MNPYGQKQGQGEDYSNTHGNVAVVMVRNRVRVNVMTIW